MVTLQGHTFQTQRSSLQIEFTVTHLTAHIRQLYLADALQYVCKEPINININTNLLAVPSQRGKTKQHFFKSYNMNQSNNISVKMQ